ncbi:MAG: T9SS C-terminal target domain-containing protein [Saprospirales bacterium]|nr:MAG: T9SS C-terminal target domain-containing protein [Saprospirales bacterium]
MQNLLKFTILKAVFFAAFNLFGQCDVLPKIEGDLMLCPESDGVIITGSFESYQWYKRALSGGDDPVAIAGATDSFLTVNYFDDVPAWFSVEVTYDTCRVRSEEVLLDGYVFLLPFVESVGDHSVGPNGETILCNGDTLVFIFSMDTNIQWFRNFEPISDATDKELIVTEGGSYHAEGAPEECPDFIMSLGLSLEVEFRNVDAIVPEVEYFYHLGDTFKILNVDDLIFWEWHCYSFWTDELIFVSNESSIYWFDSYDECAFGPYLVRSIDDNACVAWSEEVSGVITSIGENEPIGVRRIFPNPTNEFIEIEYSKPLNGLQYQLFDIKGQLLKSASLSGMDVDRIDFSDLEPGTYLIFLKNDEVQQGFKVIKK